MQVKSDGITSILRSFILENRFCSCILEYAAAQQRLQRLQRERDGNEMEMKEILIEEDSRGLQKLAEKGDSQLDSKHTLISDESNSNDTISAAISSVPTKGFTLRSDPSFKSVFPSSSSLSSVSCLTSFSTSSSSFSSSSSSSSAKSTSLLGQFSSSSMDASDRIPRPLICRHVIALEVSLATSVCKEEIVDDLLLGTMISQFHRT